LKIIAYYSINSRFSYESYFINHEPHISLPLVADSKTKEIYRNNVDILPMGLSVLKLAQIIDNIDEVANEQ
jgi:hypothetical protein